MKISDYIVDFFIEKGVTDVFGYPGGMVTHLMESFSSKKDKINAHVNYHEQAAAFCACGYAQVTGIPGVAYATSGPGATNLITGIANAWFDSIPSIFLTGQVNTFEAKGDLKVRQRGFQETDILSMIQGITKYSAYVSTPDDIRYELEKAWYYANEGRKGPVLLDLPMNIQRADIEPANLRQFIPPVTPDARMNGQKLSDFQILLEQSERPVILVGAGVKISQTEELLRSLVEKWKIPVISSMIAFDVFSRNCNNYFGFLGAYGDRTANFVAAKSDLIISIGSRLDIRQVGVNPEGFGVNAKLVRIDIDSDEFTRKIKEDELNIVCDIKDILSFLVNAEWKVPSMREWLIVCSTIREKLQGIDERDVNILIREIGKILPSDSVITTDVGQNQVWIAQSLMVSNDQRVLFSGGHGAMGYSLPAAIGAYYANRQPVVCFTGDGGFQMNIQELQFIVREHLPITVILLNNAALGMIRHFQEMYFDCNYFQTMESGGYTVPDFEKIAVSYGLNYFKIDELEDINELQLDFKNSNLVEISLKNPTYVYPKLEFGKPNQDQEPLLDRELYQYLMQL